MIFEILERTSEEKRDVFLSWKRDDKAFFASGACHILAHQFLSMHGGEGYVLVRIKPLDDLPGNHYCASNGEWVFDYHGWSLESEYLKAMEKAYRDKYANWNYDRIEISEGLVDHIASGNHNLRPPEYFPELPWKRAYDYMQQFDPNPPVATRQLPDAIKEVGFDFNWDERKVWEINASTEAMDISELVWHFDVPFLWSRPDGYYDLNPRWVIEDPEKYAEEYERTQKSDTSYPIDIMQWRGRWVILDGLHRLMKLHSEGKTVVNVRKIPESALPLIKK